MWLVKDVGDARISPCCAGLAKSLSPLSKGIIN
jgi:hypothetical protein